MTGDSHLCATHENAGSCELPARDYEIVFCNARNSFGPGKKIIDEVEVRIIYCALVFR